MRPIQKTIDIAAADDNGVATAQTPSDGVDLTLDGAYVTSGIAYLPYASTVTLASTDDLSSVIFTVKGLSANNIHIEEAITGPNNATVTTTNFFKTVTAVSVATSSSFTTETVIVGGSAVGVGTGDWWPLDIYTPNQVTTISANLLGNATGNYSVQYTNEDPFDGNITQLAVAHPSGSMTNATTDQTQFTTTLMRAVRVNVNSGSGQLRVTVVQQSTA